MDTSHSASITLGAVLRFVDIAVDALAEAREEIDALNVYPVPDGDTGTNMYLTVSAARDAVREATGGDAEADLVPALEAFSRGALLGARGNSGVILSEMLGALARRIAQAGPEERRRRGDGRGAGQATEASYAAVGDAGRGHHADRHPGRVRGGRRGGDGRRAPGPATCSRPRPQAARDGARAHARAAARCSATRASSTPAAAACA